MEYRMSKLTFNELTDKWQKVTIHCQEGIRKFSNIKIPYSSNTAITLEVAKQLLVDMSIEEFINIIKNQPYLVINHIIILFMKGQTMIGNIYMNTYHLLNHGY